MANIDAAWIAVPYWQGGHHTVFAQGLRSMPAYGALWVVVRSALAFNAVAGQGL